MLRVLLVDDEPIVKAAFRKIIPWEEEGFAITGTASNGHEALRLLAQNGADVVITDLKMPQMDGISLIKALKEGGFDGVILVLSNYADFDLVRDALVAGAMDYMLKVNIGAEALTAQLRKAKQALIARQKSQQEEKLVAEHSALVRAHALRAYLMAEGPEAPPPSQALQDAYAQGPFGFCHIIFLPPDPRLAARPPSAPHVESILRAVFEDVRETDILILGERTLGCLYPLASFLDKGIRPQDKLGQAARQIRMYFNAPVLIFTPPAANTLAELRQRHLAMAEKAALAFYALPTTILPPEAVSFQPLPQGFSPQEGAAQLAQGYFLQEEEAASAYLSRFLDACRAARTHPREAAAFLQALARELWAFTPARQAELPAQTAGWDACPQEQELWAQALALYEEILAQIIPPEFAHCKEEVRKALLYLHLHYASRVTLEEVAKAASLDRSYLCRLFKRETGTNLFAYLNALRMNAAARLMERGGAYIREISGQVGIDDPFYFTRLFKKHFGVSPSEYAHQQGPGEI